MRQMRIIPGLNTLAILLAVLLCAACPQQEQQHAGRGARVADPPETLTVAYIGDLRGFQRPCG